MSRFLTVVASASLTLGVLAPTTLLAQENPEEPAMHSVSAAELAWSPIEVPGFASGMQIAVTHGDPAVADEPYTLRLLFPDGYAFPPHWHPRAENVTVLEGTFRLAMGRSFDESKLKTYEVGDYLYIWAEQPHFGKVKGRTVVQLHGIGPFAINVVEGQEMAP